MATGLGAFTEGLQGGIQTRDRMDIAKQYKEKLRQENFEGDLAIQGKRKSAALDYTTSGGSQEDFDAMWNKYNKSQDPALIRFGKWLGGKMGIGGQPVVNEEEGAAQGMAVASPEVAPVTPQQTPIPENVHTGGGQLWVPKKADGGVIDEEEVDPRYSMDSMDIRGGYVPTSERNRTKAPRPIDSEPIYPRTRDMVDAYGKTADDLYERSQATEDPREYGDLLRQRVGNRLAQAGSVTAGFLRDTADYMMPDDLYEGVAGFAGFDGGGEDAQGVPTEPQPDPRYPNGEYPVPDDFDPNMKLNADTQDEEKAATDATAAAPARSNEQMADQAMDEAQQLALENLDYKQLVDQGMRPADLPQMPTKDWVEYRREQMAAMQMQGMNPSEALKVVDDMTVGVQMRGFQREAQKAFLYMQTGQMEEAGMALSMAYQYFPNGTSVQFATFDDPKSGRPVLVARGTDEETGEPTGKPVIVTADRLNAMVENMQNPQAFRLWTKDHQDLQMEVAKHKETVSHNRTMEDIYGYGAETDRMNAQTRRLDAQSGGEGDGFDASEQRQRSGIYRERVDKLVMDDKDFENPALREDLAAVMARVGDMYPTASPNQVEQIVLKAFRGGREQGGSVEAGVAAAQSLLTLQEGG